MPFPLVASMAIALAASAPSTLLLVDPGVARGPAPLPLVLQASSVALSVDAADPGASPSPRLAGSTVAQASRLKAAGEPEGGTSAPGDERWYALSPGKKLGVSLDLGAPEGSGLALLFRPWWWLRLNAGLAYNVLGTGIRGGFSVVPFRHGITPTLSFDLGHYFSGDLTKFTSSSNVYEQALLRSAAYDFWSLQLGVEIGSRDGFAFYMRGGLAHLGTTLAGQDVTNYANSKIGDASDSYQIGDASFSALIPCFSLGFLFFVL